MPDEDPGSNAVIHCDVETKEIQSVFFQMSWMKEAFVRYPEVLEMDTTHMKYRVLELLVAWLAAHQPH